jgi:hypothetical protein
MLARQALCHLSHPHTLSFYTLVVFADTVLYVCLGPALDCDRPISAFCIAGITGVYCSVHPEIILVLFF